MDRLRILTKVVLEKGKRNPRSTSKTTIDIQLYTHPKHIRILEVSLRVSLLSVDEVGELGRVTNEENGSIIEYPIPVTFISPELESETTRVTSSISRTRFSSNSGETSCDADFLAYILEEGYRGKITQIVSDLEVPVSASTLGMDLQCR